MSEVEQTHCVVGKVFAFTVPPLGSAEGFKASLWPKQPIWVGRLRVVSRGGKCAVLLEHTDKEGLFASCPIQNEKTVEPAIDSSRYFVLRLSDGKGRHALIGIGFNDRTQAFDFKVSLQDWENHNREGGELLSGPKTDLSIPQGERINVSFGAPAKKKKSATGADISSALSGMKLDAPPAKGEEKDKEKKKKKKKDHDEGSSATAFTANSSAASVVGASSTTSSTAATANIIDFGFGDFDPLSAPSTQSSSQPAPRRASIADPFAPDATPTFATNGKETTPFDTPFDDTPSDWVKF